MNKQFQLFGFVYYYVYVDLQYDEISLILTDGFVCLCGVCSRPWSVCEVVLVSYVNVAVLCVMLFVCMLRKYESARVTAMLLWGWRKCGCGECNSCGWYTWFRYCV